ncbi:MAG TPA: hypothetical protein VEV19_12860 [Ktedonobacteraceae bacterium]|nr:hypothetical protein [Ktedonobacteraceae bacterium]
MTVQWKSREEYFALIESDPEHRYEYLDGYIYMMTERTERPAPQFLAQSAMARFALRGTHPMSDMFPLRARKSLSFALQD